LQKSFKAKPKTHQMCGENEKPALFDCSVGFDWSVGDRPLATHE